MRGSGREWGHKEGKLGVFIQAQLAKMMVFIEVNRLCMFKRTIAICFCSRLREVLDACSFEVRF